MILLPDINHVMTLYNMNCTQVLQLLQYHTDVTDLTLILDPKVMMHQLGSVSKLVLNKDTVEFPICKSSTPIPPGRKCAVLFLIVKANIMFVASGRQIQQFEANINLELF